MVNGEWSMVSRFPEFGAYEFSRALLTIHHSQLTSLYINPVNISTYQLVNSLPSS
jgi:hypothetical protein